VGVCKDPAKAGDTRWLHRSHFDWQRAEQRHDTNTIVGRIYKGLLRLIQLRQQNLALPTEPSPPRWDLLWNPVS